MKASELRSDTKDLIQPTPAGQASRDQRSLAGTTGKAPGTSGGFFGMTGEERLWLGRAWLLGACLIAAITVVNVLTIQHDAPRLGVIRPAIWEVSSALVTIVIFGIPAAMAFWMVRKQPALVASHPSASGRRVRLFGPTRFQLRGSTQA
jgi:predicted outer membrane lipoprotein